MIPVEAVEAAAKAIHEAGDWNSDTPWNGDDWRADCARTEARAALEAAAPHMLAGTVEYAVFRKDGDEYDAPLGHRTYARRGRTEANMRQFINCDDWLEIRERTVTPWKVVK